MEKLSASKARIPPDAFGRVAYQGERIRIEKNGNAAVYLVPAEDVEFLEALEDFIDLDEAEQRLREMREGGETPVPWKKAKEALGL